MQASGEESNPDELNYPLPSVLSFTKHKKEWDANLRNTAINFTYNVEQLAIRSSIFKCFSPMTWTPDLDTIIGSIPDHREHVKVFLELIQNRQTSNSFGIVTKFWLSNLQQNPKQRRPSQHMMDVFTVNEDGDIDLWSATAGDESLQTQTWQYVLLSARITKRNILLSEPRGTDFSSLWISCHVYHITGGECPRNMNATEVRELTELFHMPAERISVLKICMASVFLQIDTPVKNILGDEHSVILTANQMETVIAADVGIFYYIEGPPGSGKTYLALYLCRKYSNYLYICTTDAFKEFLIYQGLAESRIVVMKRSKDLRIIARKNKLSQIECCIIDDCHNVSFSKKVWLKLFSSVSSCKCVIFGDSRYQYFKDDSKFYNALDYMNLYCRGHNLHLTYKTLVDVHRNTKKIVSFIKANYDRDPKYPDHKLISSSHPEEGDDVEIRYFKDVFSREGRNSLFDFVESLTYPTIDQRKLPVPYQPRDIAILIDTKHQKRDKKKLQETFSQRLIDISVHDASTFPVRGYTIDTLDNFLGLDRKVCVLIAGKGVRQSREQIGRSLANPRYRTFVSSRAISRMIFVVQSKLDTELMSSFNFVKPPVSHYYYYYYYCCYN